MGTNYYVVPNRPSVETPIHIGKSSMGWKFLFHDVNEPYWSVPVVWHTYDEVKDWLYKNTVVSKNYVIIDEYDGRVEYEEFIDLVEYKQEHYADNPDNFTYCRNVNGYRFDDREFC
jgi:hypothetical protein